MYLASPMWWQQRWEFQDPVKSALSRADSMGCPIEEIHAPKMDHPCFTVSYHKLDGRFTLVVADEQTIAGGPRVAQVIHSFLDMMSNNETEGR